MFVIEGQTPPEKLECLRQRCLAMNGPVNWNVRGNYAGVRFDSLGQTVKKLADALVRDTGRGGRETSSRTQADGRKCQAETSRE